MQRRIVRTRKSTFPSYPWPCTAAWILGPRPEKSFSFRLAPRAGITRNGPGHVAHDGQGWTRAFTKWRAGARARRANRPETRCAALDRFCPRAARGAWGRAGIDGRRAEHPDG